jgi:hypothetical protein
MELDALTGGMLAGTGKKTDGGVGQAHITVEELLAPQTPSLAGAFSIHRRS